MNCIVCDKSLRDFSPPTNQPMFGTEFIGGGDYGSAVTDQPDVRYIINVCDDCILAAIKRGACTERNSK